MKSLPREQPELVTFRIEQLHACHVGRHQAHVSVEDTAIEGVEVAFLNQQCADFMQLQRVVWRFSYGFAKLRNRHARRLKHDTTPHRQISPSQPYLGPKRPGSLQSDSQPWTRGSGSLQRA